MSNEYFTPTGVPGHKSLGQSQPQRAQWNLVEAGFDKLPELTGNGLSAVFVNAAGVALEAVDAEEARERIFLGMTEFTVPALNATHANVNTLGEKVVSIAIDAGNEAGVDFNLGGFFNYTNTKVHGLKFHNMPNIAAGDKGRVIQITIQNASAFPFTLLAAVPGWTFERDARDTGLLLGTRAKLIVSVSEPGKLFYKFIHQVSNM